MMIEKTAIVRFFRFIRYLCIKYFGMVSKIDIFAELGERLRHFGEDEYSQRVLADAIACNECDALPFVHRKTDIAKQYLRTHRFCEILY